jgi:hypothetical protein
MTREVRVKRDQYGRSAAASRATETDAMQAKVLTGDEARRVATNNCAAAGATGTGAVVRAGSDRAPLFAVRRTAIGKAYGR